MDESRRQALEALYKQPDHWNYRSDPYELRKYEQTIEIVPSGHYTRALEIGSSEGLFSRRVAPLADEVLGLDVVALAVERAREACADLPNVHFRQFDLERDHLDERFDLIFCAEVLYYLRWVRLRPIARKVTGWLAPGGYLVAVHAKSPIAQQWGFGPKGADLTHPMFKRPGVRLVREDDHGNYTLSLFRKDADVATSRAEALFDVLRLPFPALAHAAVRRGTQRIRSARGR